MSINVIVFAIGGAAAALPIAFQCPVAHIAAGACDACPHHKTTFASRG
jgi:hypothetical protein